MKSILSTVIIAIATTVVAPGFMQPQEQSVQIALSTKQITVFANNAASAVAKAQSDNPGWSVLSVKKVSKDPKSRAYRVSMKKK